MLGLRSRDCFEPLRRQCAVSLSKTRYYLLLGTGSTQQTSRHDCKMLIGTQSTSFSTKLDLQLFINNSLTLNTPIATKVVFFSRLLKCLISLYGKQYEPRSDCSGSTLFASQLNSSGTLGNYLQQTTPADDVFRCIFFLAI